MEQTAGAERQKKWRAEVEKTTVISLGGSILVPEQIDVSFLGKFRKMILELDDMRFMVICGGGKISRDYQDAAEQVAQVKKEDLDWIGIRATRLNAELVRAVLGEAAYEKVIHSPDEDIQTTKRIIIGAGFEPGSSTDLRAVQLAERFGAKRVINMSNIDYVYSADPKKDPSAKPLDALSWSQFRSMVGNDWAPGLNAPFDPIASREAERAGIEVVVIGNDLENLRHLLVGNPCKGTVIS